MCSCSSFVRQRPSSGIDRQREGVIAFSASFALFFLFSLFLISPRAKNTHTSTDKPCPQPSTNANLIQGGPTLSPTLFTLSFSCTRMPFFFFLFLSFFLQSVPSLPLFFQQRITNQEGSHKKKFGNRRVSCGHAHTIQGHQQQTLGIKDLTVETHSITHHTTACSYTQTHTRTNTHTQARSLRIYADTYLDYSSILVHNKHNPSICCMCLLAMIDRGNDGQMVLLQKVNNLINVVHWCTCTKGLFQPPILPFSSSFSPTFNSLSLSCFYQRDVQQ